MTALELAAWLASVICLGLYVRMGLTHKLTAYHWSNLLGGIVLAVFNVTAFGMVKAGPNILIEIFYALAAGGALIHDRKAAA